MNRLFLSLISLAACMTSCTSPEPLTDYVDPRIGTAHSRWFFFTPAAVPFGMAKLAPTTDGHLGNPGGWQAVGYDARHTSIEGFANFHEFQVGGVVIAPTVGALQTVPGPLDDPEAGYRSRFDKKDEVARPGYYSVLLKDYGVKAELTATERVGFHRYTFPASEEANLIFNIGTKMGESGPARDASVTFTEDGRIEGWVVTEPVYVDIYQKGAVVKMYFSALVDAEPASWGAFCGEEVFAGERSRTGVGAGVYLRFDTRARRDVGVKIGLSYTSVENARLNMQAEAADLDFDGALLAANEAWEEALGRIRVEGGKREDRVKFYTGLFHAVLGRGLASDVNGAYPANDGTVGQIPLDPAGNPLHNHYNTDAIWGGFWNLTQLWSIAYPEYYADWISSQLLVYKDAGWLAGRRHRMQQVCFGRGHQLYGSCHRGGLQLRHPQFRRGARLRSRPQERTGQRRPSRGSRQAGCGAVRRARLFALFDGAAHADHAPRFGFLGFAYARIFVQRLCRGPDGPPAGT